MNYKHNKEQVIEKGTELFWGSGFYNLGVDEICRETGMTKGAFYNSFKSKENFLLTTIGSYGLYIEKHLQKELTTNNLKAFDRLINLYENMLMAQTENNFKGCLVNNMMSEMGASNPLVAELSAKQFNLFISAIEPTVKEAQDEGDLTNAISSNSLAEVIHTAFFGFLTRSKSTRSSKHKSMTTFLNTIKKTTNGNN